MRRYILCWQLLFLVVALSTAIQARETAIPPQLEPWVDWVLEAHQDVACPLAGDLRVCVWPGRLRLDLDDRGGRFSLDLHADRKAMVALPGGAAQWPLTVRDGDEVVVLRRDRDRPTAEVGAGKHRLSGSFRWKRLPQSLIIPAEVALISLRVRGEEIAFPRRDRGGLLWLEPGVDKDADSDRLAIEVHRRIADGVPVVVETWLRLRVSGSSREIALGSPLPAGFEAIVVASGLPTKLDPDGGLRVQLRPGEWEIRIAARSLGPVHSIQVPGPGDPWPDEETWVFAAAPEIRSVRLEGLPGVDPKRTTLPEAWRGLPAFRAKAGSELELAELRRGAAVPGPDDLEVQRVIWLSQDGRLFTVRDRLTGQLEQGGRLDLQEPGVLGRASIQGEDRLITLGRDSRAGLEMRAEVLDMRAELTYEREGALPAVGWNRDARTLVATLHLPPGWRLLTTLGVDHADGAWLSSWTLLDLFFLLVTSLASWRLFGARVGVLALLVLGISWHESAVPHLGWLFLLATVALLKILPEGSASRMVTRLRWMVVGVLCIQWVVFAWQETRSGIFPQLEVGVGDGLEQGAFVAPASSPTFQESEMQDEIEILAETPMESLAEEEDAPKVAWVAPEKKRQSSLAIHSKQSDASAIVQTGPGIPSWRWRSHVLEWKGPVAKGEQFRLLLISPGLERFLALVRVIGLGLLGGLLLGWKPPSPSLSIPASAASAVFLGLFLFGGQGLRSEEMTAALPEPGLLQELERRLTRPPECHPNCVEVGQVALRADEKEISFTVELHAVADSFWRLPGPESSWRPTKVEIDGRSAALRRLDDGFLALRLVSGSHRIRAVGPARDGLTLRFPLVPRFLDWHGEGWVLEGFSEDDIPPRSVRLARQHPMNGEQEDDGDLVPWVQVRRRLDLGIPWLVQSEIRRLGPAGPVVLLQIPLLEGESVTSPNVSVEGDFASVRLEAGETYRRWDSTLEERDRIVLEAAMTSEWTETWELACSPIFSCRPSGLAASRTMSGGRWLPEWHPWPGESLTIEVSRPAVAVGVATTIDGVELIVEPGRRLRESMLSMRLRTSQGGEQSLEIPDSAELQSFEIDGTKHSVRRDGQRLTYSLDPGEHRVNLKFRETGGTGFLERAPGMALDRDAVNMSVTMRVPDNRWLLWAGGPSWGPVVSLWQYVFVLLLVAWILSRVAPTPLRYLDWLLLGVGMTQVPLFAPIMVVAFFLVLGSRERIKAPSWWSHNLYQLALAVFALVAMGCLWAAVQQGLLVQPDMQVIGGNSYGSTLSWYVDRVVEDLPRPWVLWVPLWVWRVVMLLWALWLAARLMKWIPWGWEKFGSEGLWRPRPAPGIGGSPRD